MPTQAIVSCQLRRAAVLAAACAHLASPAWSDVSGMRVLFPYFQGNGESGVYLAVSTDGLTFLDANAGRPIFTPPAWDQYEPAQNLTRDPSIVYHDGIFHMVWTSNWWGEIIGYASSKDLLNWSEPRPIRPFADDARPKNLWAPELDYDPVRDDFFIVFSSTLPVEFDDGDGSEDQHGNDHRPYVIRTTDFSTFSEPRVLFDPGLSTIDPDPVYDDRGTDTLGDDRWIMVYKREVSRERGGKNIRIGYRDPAWQTPWRLPEAPIAGPGSSVRPNESAEGPTLISTRELGGARWLLYWDAYGNGHYSVAASEDLRNWEDLTDQMLPPRAHPRHGSPFIAPIDAVAVPMPEWPPAPDRTLAIEPAGRLQARDWSQSTWAGGAHFIVDDDGARDGTACLRVTSPYGADAAWGRTLSVKPQTRYRLSGWIRTRGLEADSGMGAVLNIEGRRGAATPPVTGTTDWTPVSVEFTTGRETSVRVLCLFGGWGTSRGAAWYAGIRLEER